MKVFAVMFFVGCGLFSESQYLLFDRHRDNVGSLSFVGKSAYLKVKDAPVETFHVILATKFKERTFYYVENNKADGYIMIDPGKIVCDFLLVNKEHYYEVFYREIK